MDNLGDGATAPQQSAPAPVNNDFLPQGYEPPKSEGGAYLKFNNPSTKFRILSSPVLGWEAWSLDNKPKRWPNSSKPTDQELQGFREQKVKHFWGLEVYSYENNEVMVLSITQGTIINAITALANAPEWGSPLGYDITVNKTGSGLETNYTVLSSPPTPLAEDVQAVVMDMAGKIVLAKLFTDESPFIG